MAHTPAVQCPHNSNRENLFLSESSRWLSNSQDVGINHALLNHIDIIAQNTSCERHAERMALDHDALPLRPPFVTHDIRPECPYLRLLERQRPNRTQVNSELHDDERATYFVIPEAEGILQKHGVRGQL